MFLAGGHLGPVPVETQANPLPQLIRENGPSICPVLVFLFVFFFEAHLMMQMLADNADVRVSLFLLCARRQQPHWKMYLLADG